MFIFHCGNEVGDGNSSGGGDYGDDGHGSGRDKGAVAITLT